MHLRRAVLLFAIVLGLAALAASVSRPRDDRSGLERPPAGSPRPPVSHPSPTLAPGPLPNPPVEVTFDAAKDETRRVEIDRSATVQVKVDELGMVEIPALGLSAPAEPVTPARFDLLTSEVRRLAIIFTPAASDEARPAGTLVVTPAVE